MSAHRTTYSANPALAWSRIAMNMGEMLFASAQVIGHRSQRMALAGAVPNARDQREFRLMGQEKIEAATESMQAMSWRMLAANQQVGALLLRQWMAGATRWMTLAATPALFWPGRGQERWLREAIRNTSAVSSQLSGSAAHLAHAGLKPVHSRATANAKRLLKA